MKKTKGANTMLSGENKVKFDELSEEQLKEVSGGVTFPVPRPSDSERGFRLDDKNDVSWNLDDDDGGWTAEIPETTKPGTYRLYGISY